MSRSVAVHTAALLPILFAVGAAACDAPLELEGDAPAAVRPDETESAPALADSAAALALDAQRLDTQLKGRRAARCVVTSAFTRVGIREDLAEAVGHPVDGYGSVHVARAVASFASYGVDGLSIAAATSFETAHGFDGSPATDDPVPARVTLTFGGGRARGEAETPELRAARALYDAMRVGPRSQPSQGATERRSPRGHLACTAYSGDGYEGWSCSVSNVVQASTQLVPCRDLSAWAP